MRTEPGEFVLHRRTRQFTASQHKAASVLATSNLRIVDEAFADLETITLRRDNPSGTSSENSLTLPYEGIVQEFASQLQALEKQHQHLTQLLNELQSPAPAAP
jgi:hypothetical protein